MVTDINVSNGGRSASPCWHCGCTVSSENVGYNIYTNVVIKDPIYHSSVIKNNTAAPCEKYRWLCWRCAKVEGYLW